jgi:hypothetical protein
MRPRVVDNPEERTGTFHGELQTQLDGAPGATYLLTAELLYLPCRTQPFQSSHRP